MRPDGWCNPPKPASASSPALVSWLNIEVKPPFISVPHYKDTAQSSLCSRHHAVVGFFLFVLANNGLNTYAAIVALLNKPQARSV